MAKVLLIKVRLPVMDRFWTAVSPPLGPLFLAAYARQQRPGKDEFLLIDERVEPKSDADFRRVIENFCPDVIGLSVLTTEFQRLEALVPVLEEAAPEVPLLIGGPHATAEGERVLAQFPRSYVCRGESELSFVQLLDSFDRGERFPERKISGLMYRRPDGSAYEVAYNSEVADTASLPTPAWDLVDFGVYEKLPRMTPINIQQRYAPLFTSRGCPYRCIYCHDVFGKGFRAWSPARVVDEIELLIDQHGVHDFEIYDDIFNADYKRALAICNEIKRRNLRTHFAFPNGVRGDRMNAELLQALADVGTYHMAFAVESASPRIQKLIKKHNRSEALHENIAIAAKAGIFCWGFFMLGFPTETKPELHSTVDFALSSSLHGAFFFQVIPFGGTELSEAWYDGATVADEAGDGDYHYTDSSRAAVSSEELRRIQWQAYLRFYYDPRRMLRVVRDYPLGKRKLLRKALGFTRATVMDRAVTLAASKLDLDVSERWGASSWGYFSDLESGEAAAPPAVSAAAAHALEISRAALAA